MCLFLVLLKSRFSRGETIINMNPLQPNSIFFFIACEFVCKNHFHTFLGSKKTNTKQARFPFLYATKLIRY